MIGRGISVLALTAALLVPSSAAAEWYGSPFFGKIQKIKFAFPTESSKTVIGVSAGTAPFDTLGLEIDFGSSNELFGSKDDLGSNSVRTITVGALGGYPIKFNGTVRLKPYGVFGGGLGIVDLGTDFDFDFESFTPAHDLCYFNLPENPTRAQILGCGLPGTEEDLLGYKGMLNYGGGVMAFLAPHIGAKADFRYFRSIDKDERLEFWRYTIGVVIH
jgi:hypothetical protein